MRKGRYTQDIFHPKYIFPVCIENIFWDNSKYFEMSLQYFEEKKYLFIKMSFYHNIFLSQFCV